LTLDRLVEAVDGHGHAYEWLSMMDSEWGLVESMCRLQSEENRAARNAAVNLSEDENDAG
jgi:hypothetical protein